MLLAPATLETTRRARADAQRREALVQDKLDDIDLEDAILNSHRTYADACKPHNAKTAKILKDNAERRDALCFDLLMIQDELCNLDMAQCHIWAASCEVRGVQERARSGGDICEQIAMLDAWDDHKIARRAKLSTDATDKIARRAKLSTNAADKIARRAKLSTNAADKIPPKGPRRSKQTERKIITQQQHDRHASRKRWVATLRSDVILAV